MTIRKQRIPIPNPLRSQILIANQHACCICGKPGVQIHHINGDPADNSLGNLAVLCIPHHDKATSVTGLSAKLSVSQIRKYKRIWEQQCHERVMRAARGRTAFFMVDYKNAERIRQAYSQLARAEYQQAFEILTQQFQEEEILRKNQGFSVSLEPNTSWNEHTRRMLSWVQAGNPHPEPFHKAEGHPQDSLLPTGAIWLCPEVPYYDLWCQIMVRAIIAVRDPYDIDDLLKLEEPKSANLTGSLVAFEGTLNGHVMAPKTWEKQPRSLTELTCKSAGAIWRCQLKIKTHYVYSVTAAESLGKGRGNGILLLRSIDSSRRRNGKRVVVFDAIPLIIGSGVLRF